MKLYILDAAHKSIPCINFIAINDPQLIFYVHVDKKFTLDEFFKNIKNLIYIDHRMDVKWGGFSQVQVTLNLFEASLRDSNADFFRFISCEFLILCEYQLLIENLCWDYAQFFDKLIPTKKLAWFGGGSIKTQEIEKIIENISCDDIKYVKRRLNPDEHFFQYLIVRNQMLDKVSVYGNKRYIKFNPNFQRGSSPVFLNSEQLAYAQKQNYWFARKVEQQEMQRFYLNSNEE